MIALPILIPLFGGVFCLLAWNHTRWQRVITVIGSTLLLIVAIWMLFFVQQNGIQSLQIGNWSAPFGIVIAVDLFNAIMVLVAATIAFVLAIYAQVGMDMARIRYGFFSLYFFLLMGVNGAFITGDLFNLYVWFEVMLMSSFVLIALGGERPQIEGSIKYVILNLLSSILFLSGIGLVYNLGGTLNMADLALNLPQVKPAGQVTLVAILFMVAFGIKSAAFPLFFWLPASYHTPPVTITALFSGLLTKVGVYSLFRVFTLLFTQDTQFTHTILLVIAGFTMVTGVLGAAAQTDMRRLLSFHIVSQIGYLLMGLGLFSKPALAASIYFMVHVILAKTALFLVAGIVDRMQGSFDLKKLGGLYKTHFGVALLFLLPAFSLAGIPPLSGFFAKLLLVIAGFELHQGIIIAVALGVSVLTLYSMTKVWNEAFWKEPPEKAQALKPVSAWMWAPVIGLVVISVCLGLFADPVMGLAEQAAGQLINPSEYIQAVMGVRP